MAEREAKNIQMVCEDHAPKPNARLAQIARTIPLMYMGKFVKKAFEAADPRTFELTVEHMWVRVFQVMDDGTLVGRLDNDPIFITEEAYGDVVTVLPEEIQDVAP